MTAMPAPIARRSAASAPTSRLSTKTVDNYVNDGRTASLSPDPIRTFGPLRKKVADFFSLPINTLRLTARSRKGLRAGVGGSVAHVDHIE
jgi:hypothetical protein